MAYDGPFARGENAKLRFYQAANGAMKPVIMAVKQFKVSENATEINEGVAGENRDRLDKVTNFYDISFDVYQPDAVFLEAYLAAQDQLDANGVPLKQLFSVQQEFPTENKAYALQQAIVGPVDFGMTSRADPNMLTVKARARYLKPIPTF